MEAHNVGSGSGAGSSSGMDFKSLLARIIIGSGLLIAIGSYIKNKFIETTTYYYCNVNLFLGKNPLSEVMLKFSGDSLLTDDYGHAVFKAKKGNYVASFKYKNKRHAKNCFIKTDTTIVVDISSSLSDHTTGLPVANKLHINQPVKSPRQQPVKIPNALKIGITDKDLKEKKDTAIAKVTIKKITADEVIDALQLRVKVDKDDSRKGRYAYHYFLSGNKEYLDQIIQVYYQRNDDTFPEFASKEYIPSDERQTNFEFVSYQYGDINTAYVQIILKNNEKSNIYLKLINYN